MVHQHNVPRRLLIIDARAEVLDTLVADITDLLARSGVGVQRVLAGDETDQADEADEAGATGVNDGTGAGRSTAPAAAVPPGPGPEDLSVGDLVVCPDARTAHRGGGRLTLTRIEFDLLVQFLRHVNRVLTKEALLSSVWHHEPVTPNAIEARISRLRSKLERHGPRVIHTVRGVGYVLHALPEASPGADGSVIELIASVDHVVLDTSQSLAR